MKDKYTEQKDDDEIILSQNNEYRNFNLIRPDNDLFDENLYIPGQIVSVKSVRYPKRGIECWEISVNGKKTAELDGNRFSKKEKTFLYSVLGMQFIVSQFKCGLKSISEFKRNLSSQL